MSGTPVVETTRAAVATTLNETTIETTPILGRKFEDLLTLTPGVSIVQGPDGDEITFAGQRGVFNNISLDGGDFNNGFFGEQAGGQRAPIDITLDAVKEFQVIASGAPAEFGRTAGGVVNVITKSGTNERHGSVFHFQRLEGLTSDQSDGTKLENFHREQFGGTIGGPIRRDHAFYFVALEGITGDFQRQNLGRTIGTPCPVAAPTIPANAALINAEPDCQRLALLNFFQTRLNQDEGQPIDHPIKTVAMLLKGDMNLGPATRLSTSYNFNHSRKQNETFDVASYGTSANGTEGDPARINVVNANLFTTFATNRLNEFHFTYSRETRPRTANESNLKADTGIGFAPSFRFGNPFFLQPNVDELIWRTQIKDNISIVRGGHTWKMGGEWMHTLNDQVFRGFFTGRYLFESVEGFLRYTSPAAPGGFGPRTAGCSNGSYVTLPTPCPAGTTTTGGPLFFYLQGASRSGLATDATGASTVANEELSLFIQDQWHVRSNVTLQYGLRWDAQLMPETVDPQTTAFGPFLNESEVPIGRHDSRSEGDVAAACRGDVGRARQRALGAAHERRHLLRAPEHAQPGRVGDDQRPAAADALRQHRQHPAVRRRSAHVAGRAHADAGCRRTVPVVQRRARLPSRLRESAHDDIQRWLRAGSRHRCRRVCRLHICARAPSDALHQLQPRRCRQPVQPSTRRSDGDDEPRALGLQRPDARPAEAHVEGVSARGELRARARQRR